MSDKPINSTVYLTDIDVSIRYSVNRSTIWRWYKEGKFPKPVKLGEAATRWRIVDLEAWEKTRDLGGISQ